MLQRFATDELDRLLDHRGPKLSILLPTPWRGEEARQVGIVLKDLLREAESLASDGGLGPEDAAALLDPLRGLGDEAESWREARESAVLFTATGFFRAYHLSRPATPRASLGERFYLRPLIAELHDPAFHVLAISLNEVRLLECRRDACRVVELSGVPTNFESAVGRLQYNTDLQLHTTGASGPGRRAAMFHGHGDNDEEHFEDDVLNYFRAIARGLAQHLDKSRASLVLAAVAEYFPLLRRAGLPGTVLEEGVAGNPDHVPDHELQRAAAPLVEAWLQRAVQAEVLRFGDLAAHGQGSLEPPSILRAGADGRIQVLLTAAEAELWGTFDSVSRSLAVHHEREIGDEELVNRAVCDTLAGRGTVHELPQAELPEGAPMAALYRY